MTVATFHTRLLSRVTPTFSLTHAQFFLEEEEVEIQKINEVTVVHRFSSALITISAAFLVVRWAK